MGMFGNNNKKSYCGTYKGVSIWQYGCIIGSSWYGDFYITQEKNGRNYKVTDSVRRSLADVKKYIDEVWLKNLSKPTIHKVRISQGGVEAVFSLSDEELMKLRRHSRNTTKATMGNCYNFAMFAFFDYETSRAKSGRFNSLFNYHKGDFWWYLEDDEK